LFSAAGFVEAKIPRIADSSPRNAVSFSSAHTTKRFSSRCASAIQIAPRNQWLRGSTKLQSAFFRLSAMIFHARFLDFVQEVAPAALIAPPVVQAALWTRATRTAPALSKLRFPAVEVAAVVSYCCCHIVRVTSASWMRLQRLGRFAFKKCNL